MDKDFLLESYNFHLPEEQIAQTPAKERDASRLLVYSLLNKTIEDAQFCNLVDIIENKNYSQKPLFIANNSKVLPARLLGFSPHGGKREMLLLSPLPLLEIKEIDGQNYAIAEVLLKPSKSANIGDTWLFNDKLAVKILEKFAYGNTRVELSWQGNLADIFNTYGYLPLPPYIKREKNSHNEQAHAQRNLDSIRYQTSYAKEDKLGSVAAPTAGLHFTNNLQENLIKSGCLWEEVTLHVGYGTFTPVRAENIQEHTMHYEHFEISKNCAKAILEAKKNNRPIIAVGTTSCRVLEGAVRLWQEQKPNVQTLLPEDGIKGATNIFIYPKACEYNGYSKEFHVIDGLITNFHLPQSSLLMLVSALSGREEMLKVYKHAIEANYRFFSYGDAMFIA